MLYIDEKTKDTAVSWTGNNFSEVHNFCLEAVHIKYAVKDSPALCNIWGEKLESPGFIIKNNKTGEYTITKILPEGFEVIEEKKGGK